LRNLPHNSNFEIVNPGQNFRFEGLEPIWGNFTKKSIGGLSFIIRSRWEKMVEEWLKKASALGTETCYRKTVFSNLPNSQS